jgi:hypothetical protein
MTSEDVPASVAGAAVSLVAVPHAGGCSTAAAPTGHLPGVGHAASRDDDTAAPHDCVPAGPVSEVVCAACGDGPLLAGPLAGVDPAADPAVAGWLGAEGWQLEPVLICPACRRGFVRTSSW